MVEIDVSQVRMAAMSGYSYAYNMLRLMCQSHDVVQMFTIVAQQHNPYTRTKARLSDEAIDDLGDIPRGQA